MYRMFAVAGILAVALFLVVAPPFIGLAAAVAAAIGWTLWLERHPEERPRAEGGIKSS